jgi:hypothetical protein
MSINENIISGIKSTHFAHNKIMRPPRKTVQVIAVHIILGAVLGVLVLHPATMAIYWFEFHPEDMTTTGGFWQFLAYRIKSSFTMKMLPMSGVFALIGGGLGCVFGMYYLTIIRKNRSLNLLEEELGRDFLTLIESGEGERIEFKASLRWDFRQGRVNKAMEGAIAKTICGFLNHRGGNLFIGVNDSGEVTGLENDYKTLKRKNRDGFGQFIVNLVKERLGGDVCSLVHVVFIRVKDTDVCRVIIERSQHPVYYIEGGISRYFLRAGNTIRELDVREALKHVDQKHK